MINLGLNKRPTFFGCSPENNTNPGPLIVYIPNAPYTNYSNVTTFQLEYTTEQRQEIILNGYNVATMANATVDVQWPACLGCAILDRSLRRTGTQVPSVCGDCFQRYCWNGTVNDTTPATYEPTQIVEPSSEQPSSGERARDLPIAVGFVVGVLYFGAWCMGCM